MSLRSLRAKLVLWTIAPLGMIAAIDVGVAYHSAMRTASLVQERQLMGSARMIAEQVRYVDGALVTTIPPAALELFASSEQLEHPDHVYYRVSAPDGTLLSGYFEMATPGKKVVPETHVYFDTALRGETVHAVAFSQPVLASQSSASVLIEVGQTQHARDALARAIWQRSVQEQLLTLAAATLLIVVALRYSLAPLLALRDRVRRRAPGALEPLETGEVPNELKPLVDAINDYTLRLGRYITEHDRFIGDASHQLRTPLTVFNTQVTYALRQTDVAEKDRALRTLRQGLRGSIRLVNQLLAYTEVDEKTANRSALVPVDLCTVARHVLEELALLSQEKSIDLGFECDQPRMLVMGTEHTLTILLNNLVDNALRYTPEGGSVTIRVRHGVDGGVQLVVEDNGPGIAPADRDKVFERFFRLHGEDTPGCGLGLAIVREIAANCRAEIALSAPERGTGLIVTIDFPALAQ